MLSTMYNKKIIIRDALIKIQVYFVQYNHVAALIFLQNNRDALSAM